MAGTSLLDQLVQLAAARGAVVRLLGDDRQLPAVEGGGALRLVAAAPGTPVLSTLYRFRDPGEAAATLQLRTGDASAVDWYHQHGRIRSGSREAMAQAAYTGWKNDMLDGKVTLMAAADGADVTELSAQARADRVTAGQVEADGASAAGRQPRRGRRLDRHPAQRPAAIGVRRTGLGQERRRLARRTAPSRRGADRPAPVPRRARHAARRLRPRPGPAAVRDHRAPRPGHHRRHRPPAHHRRDEPRGAVRAGHPRPRAAPSSTSPPTTCPTTRTPASTRPATTPASTPPARSSSTSSPPRAPRCPPPRPSPSRRRKPGRCPRSCPATCMPPTRTPPPGTARPPSPRLARRRRARARRRPSVGRGRPPPVRRRGRRLGPRASARHRRGQARTRVRRQRRRGHRLAHRRVPRRTIPGLHSLWYLA